MKHAFLNNFQKIFAISARNVQLLNLMHSEL